MKISCKNVQNLYLAHAHKLKFGLVFLPFFLAFSFPLLSTLDILSFGQKVLMKSLVNPEKRTSINYRGFGLFNWAPILHQKVIVFFSISSVRMQPIRKMNSSVKRSNLALSVAFHQNLLTCKLMTSQVVHFLLLHMSMLLQIGTERVKAMSVSHFETPTKKTNFRFFLEMKRLLGEQTTSGFVST